MAVVAQTFIPRASQDDADRLDQMVEAAMMETGGPPAGLMAHLGYPSGDGFVVCNVWRNEAEMRSFDEAVLLPKLAEAGLEPADPLVSPLWSFARP